MGITLESSKLKNGPIFLSMRTPEEIKPENLLIQITKVAQSSSVSNLLGEPMTLKISCACQSSGGCNPDGEGGVFLPNGLLTNSSTKDDKTCLFRAAAMGFVQKHMNSNVNRIAKSIGLDKAESSKTYVISLIRGCGVKLNSKVFPIELMCPMIEDFYSKTYPQHGPYRLEFI